MSTACMRGSRIATTALTLLTLPLLFGQGCPTTGSGSSQITANAGPDRKIQTGVSIVIQASASGGSGVFSYSWSPATSLSNATVLQPTFTAGEIGTTTYTLTVTDNLGNTVSDSVVITVVSPSDSDTDTDTDTDTDADTTSPVVVNAGTDKSTAVGAPVTLEGSASGGTAPYTYLWSPSTGLSSPSVAQPLFTPSVSGTINLKLTVTDSVGNVGSDTVSVSVAPSATLTALMWGANFNGGGYEVLATFSRDMNRTSAQTLSNYHINGSNEAPVSAALADDNRTVSLVFAQRLSSITRLDVGTGGALLDALGGPVTAVTNQAIGANTADDTGPSAASRTWGDGKDQYNVAIQFNEAMDRASCESISNYTLAGVQPTSATLDSTGMGVTLVFPTTTAGFRSSDALQISANVKDINGQSNTTTNAASITAHPSDATGPAAAADARVWKPNATGYQIDVTFNEVMDRTSVETLANYHMNGNLPTAAALNANGRTVTLTFGATVVGLAKNDTLTIDAGVTDINGQSTVSTAATTVTASSIDTAGPSLSNEQGRRWAPDALVYTVLLNFSEAMDRTSATTLTNYTLAGNAGLDTQNPATAVLDTTGRIVTLTFPSTVAGINRTDLLTISSQVQDINGRALTSTLPSVISSGPADTTPPSALSRTWKADSTTYQVEIVFSEVMDKMTAANLSNYRIHGNGGLDVERPTAASLDALGKTLTLTFATSVAGFKRVDAVEILPAVVDINGRATSSITTVNAIISANGADGTGASVIRVTKVNDTTVDVVFSEVLDKTSVEAATFVCTGGVTVDAVALRNDGATVRLTVSAADPLAATLTIPSVQDVNNQSSAQVNKVIAGALTVDAGADINTTVGTLVTLTAPTVAGGVGPYTYSWTPAASLVGPTTSAPSFTPTSVGTFNFTVLVTDSEGRTATDTVAVIASPI